VRVGGGAGRAIPAERRRLARAAADDPAARVSSAVLLLRVPVNRIYGHPVNRVLLLRVRVGHMGRSQGPVKRNQRAR
jgi:hypothetical protein